MTSHSRPPGAGSISRRTVLKGLGLAVAGSALPAPFGRVPRAEAQEAPGPATRCFIYLNHARGTQWVAGALLVADSRLPRQLLRRAKRARLRRAHRRVPIVDPGRVPDEFKRYLYGLLAREKGFRKGLGQGLEVYGIRLDTAMLQGLGDRIGPAQVHLVLSLLDACRLARFREIFVYHDLPAFNGISRKAFRAAVLAQARRHQDARLEIREDRAWHRRPGFHQAPFSVDEGIQLTDFVVYALFQKYEYGNPQWFGLIRRLVRREINAALDPALRRLGVPG